MHMVDQNAARYTQTDPKDWLLEIFVWLVIVLILVAGAIFWHLETRRSESPKRDIVAFETYFRCSQELDLISESYSKNLKADP